MSEHQLTVAEAIEGTHDRFLSIAPSQMKFESEKGFAIQILKNNDYLMGVAINHPQSLQQALTNVAAIGLSLNPAEKQAYLIPRAVKVKINGQEKYVTKIFLEPSYMGLIKLATDSGSIKWVQALPVYANDEFTFNGVGLRPGHTFNPFAKLEQRGEFIGVYCVAKTVDDDFLVTMMSADQVYDIRGRSEQWKKNQSGPWKTDFIEQAKKSVIRNGFKTWPRTDLNRMAQAVEISNSNEGFEPILTSPNLGDYTAETKEYFDQLISRQDAFGMFVLQCSLNEKSDGAFTNLYHSFEKGQKGKYQRIVDDLLKRGFSVVEDMRVALCDAIDAGDDMAKQQLIEEMSEDALAVVKNGLSHDYAKEL
jgi:phage RecT family recombinase